MKKTKLIRFLGNSLDKTRVSRLSVKEYKSQKIVVQTTRGVHCEGHEDHIIWSISVQSNVIEGFGPVEFLHLTESCET